MVVIHQSIVGASLRTVGAGLGTVGAGLGTQFKYPPITEQQNPPSSPINEQQNPPSPLGRVQSRTVEDSIAFGRDRAPAMGMGSELAGSHYVKDFAIIDMKV
ncbi:MAG: hypothetical protein RIE73_08205 [Coleofasciculus sp. C1-SOL-03]|uniref:hypothetical protein n=1 Tax=Coleofasciculus sp. C1-SOL-03 TaxID=3069522 RepID=UPI0032F9F4B6